MAELKHGDRVYLNNKAGVIQYASTHEADVTWDNGRCTTVSTDDLLTEQEWNAMNKKQSGPTPHVVELHAGDSVLLCLSDTPTHEEWSRFVERVGRRMGDNIEVGLIAGVTGILIKRGNDEANETGGGS